MHAETSILRNNDEMSRHDVRIEKLYIGEFFRDTILSIQTVDKICTCKWKSIKAQKNF